MVYCYGFLFGGVGEWVAGGGVECLRGSGVYIYIYIFGKFESIRSV